MLNSDISFKLFISTKDYKVQGNLQFVAATLANSVT